jgi:hypothetical protein
VDDPHARLDMPNGERRTDELDDTAGTPHRGEMLSVVKDRADDVDLTPRRDELRQGLIDAAVGLVVEVFGAQRPSDHATHDVEGRQQRGPHWCLGAEAMRTYPSMDARRLPRDVRRNRAARRAVQRMASG